jgi:hypothetical protein
MNNEGWVFEDLAVARMERSGIRGVFKNDSPDSGAARLHPGYSR